MPASPPLKILDPPLLKCSIHLPFPCASAILRGDGKSEIRYQTNDEIWLLRPLAATALSIGRRNHC